MAVLTDLPPEILFEIFEGLSISVVARLVAVYKSFSDLATHVVVARLRDLKLGLIWKPETFARRRMNGDAKISKYLTSNYQKSKYPATFARSLVIGLCYPELIFPLNLSRYLPRFTGLINLKVTRVSDDTEFMKVLLGSTKHCGRLEALYLQNGTEIPLPAFQLNAERMVNAFRSFRGKGSVWSN
ncbi:hypothetical protein SAICODRAFT_9570 [Saitoella complicata NRRL Y-17804]|uniref:uncharacterized protein n=1 Tax=Saitoella complicata (strain BCRC 22490 / CBS 7301 / JCM 7358 / NBRC 10748 / NRRL Y-17804) TaxID=698492 RepID=UPI000866D3AD|nr:uncharacterized protein SAICODRAFT_9570 [Saitoella complicata NRRL Y-17804]ODQ50929.1 hypothetical protein SAICODRAFT_9570 [Saitoella complicata NRRL Y-17804]